MWELYYLLIQLNKNMDKKMFTRKCSHIVVPRNCVLNKKMCDCVCVREKDILSCK